MAKPKTFKRDDALTASVSVFWDKGYADTSIKDLEAATTLKKSSLYAEFESKENLFLGALEHYSKTMYGAGILDLPPLGWGNIENYLRLRSERQDCHTGCFLIYAIREYNTLSPRIQRELEDRIEILRAQFMKNIAAEKTSMEPEKITDMFMVFFTGLAVNDNFKKAGVAVDQPVREIIDLLKSL